MEMLTEEMNPNSPPPWSTQACTQPQVMASHEGRGGGGNWDGAAEQLPGGQSPAGPDVPRQPPPSPTAGAPSQGLALNSPGCSPSPDCSPSPSPGWLETLREPEQGAVGGTELPGPQTVEWDLAGEEIEWEPYLGHELPQWGKESVQELDQWEYERYQELPQWRDVRVQEPFPWECKRHKEASQWENESVQELDQWEYERYQESSQWRNENDQKLYEWEYDRHEESSQWGDVSVHTLFPLEYECHKKPSQWGDESDQKLYQWEYERYHELSQWEGSIDHELCEKEVRQDPELSQRGHRRDIEKLQKGWEDITTCTIWINPKYPQLLQDPDAAPQDSAVAEASPALAGQVKAAGALSQGPAPHSPCCPPGPSAPQPGAQALREQPAPPQKRPSRFRRALRALRALLCWPCRRARPDNRCPLPAPGWAPQVTAGFDVHMSGTSVPCQENGLAEE